MKLSVLPVSLFPQFLEGKISIPEWAEFAQRLGVDGYDISSMFYKNHTATFIEEIESGLKERNISIQPVMVSCYPDFTHPDPLERERQIEYLRRDIALSSRLGFQYIRITAGQDHPGITIEDGVRTVKECFSKVVETAEHFGVKLVFENHSKPLAWPRYDFTFNPEAFIAVSESIKDLNIGINFDTANAIASGADPAALLESVIDRVWTVHLNETSTANGYTAAPLGQGLVNCDEVFRTLDAHGFNGWVCVEEVSGNGWQGICDAIAYARQYTDSRR